MIVTILLTVVLLVAVLIILGVRFTYSLVAQRHMKEEKKSTLLDIFLYLGLGVTLVVSVTNFLQVVFSAIDRRFVDMLSSHYYIDTTYSDVRFAIASLVVLFPIHLLISWYTNKDIETYLYKSDSAPRKLYFYITLFVTVLSLIGTLVSVVYTYLGGELSTRFFLKALSVSVVAGTLFAYAFYSLKRSFSTKSYVAKFIGIGSVVVVVGSIMWSISVIGSPSEMRAKKIDDKKLSDLSRIQQEIYNKLQTNDKLPETLSELNNAFQGYSVPEDPLTGEAYEYRVIEQPTFKTNYETRRKEMVTQASFELCALFSTTRVFDSRGRIVDGKTFPEVTLSDSSYLVTNYYYEGDQSPYWNHEAGRTCFKRVITKDMYYGK